MFQAVNILLILVGVGAFIYGIVGLAKFAFRLSTGQGLAVALCPPYAIYFSVARLEEPGKELPTAMVIFGLLTALAMSVLSVNVNAAVVAHEAAVAAEEAKSKEVVPMPSKPAAAPVVEAEAAPTEADTEAAAPVDAAPAAP